MKTGLSLIFLVFITLILASCKTRELSAKHPPEEQVAIVQKPSKKSNTPLFIEGIKEKNLGNYDKAISTFQKCTELDPADAASRYELARLCSITGNNEEALSQAEKASAFDPGNKWYLLFLENQYRINGKQEECARVMQDLVNLEPENINYLFELANILATTGRYNESVGVLDRIEKIIGINEQIAILKQKIYQQMGNEEKAINEIIRLTEAFPAEGRYYAILAEAYMQRGEEQKALEAYYKILEFNADDPYIHISLADYYRKKNDREKAFEELKLGFSNPSLDIDTKVKILLAYYTVNEIYADLKDEALELANILASTHPDDPKAFSMLADLLFQQDKFTEARDAFRKVIAIDSTRYIVWEQLLFVETELRDYRSIASESRRAIKLFPQQPMLYLFSGMANIQLKNYSEAIDRLNKGVGFVVRNNAMLAQFYSYLGDAYNFNKEYLLSDENYDKALKLEPENTLVLNNYAYYLSLRNTNLEKAREMSEKAVKIDSANAANLDTYAWVLYKLGNYPEALFWIEKALQSGGEKDDTILEHCGDIYFRLGRHEEAVSFWKQAREQGKGSGFLDKKITEGKIFE